MTQFLSQFKRIKSCDMVLFFCVFLLVMIGLIMIFSTMSIVGQSQFDDGFFFIKRQFVFLSIGGLGLLTGLLIPHQLYKKYALYGYFLGVFLLIMTLIPGVGVKVGGAQRWIDSGFLLFQPIELVKFFLAVFFATAISNKQAEIHLFTKGLVPILGLSLFPVFLLMMQPDLGNSGDQLRYGKPLIITAKNHMNGKPIRRGRFNRN